MTELKWSLKSINGNTTRPKRETNTHVVSSVVRLNGKPKTITEGNMRFEYQYDEGSPKIIVEIGKDADIAAIREALRAFLLACTYAPESVNELLGDEE